MWICLDGIEACAASVQGLPSLEVRGEARERLLQAAAGEQQAAHRGSAHRPEMPGAVKEALLHSSREARILAIVVNFCFGLILKLNFTFVFILY